MLLRSLAIFLYSGWTFAASYPVLTYSTYLRDNFTPKAIATDSAGNIYMAGTTVVDASLLQTTMLVVKLNPQATQYLYVRYIGGSLEDYANAIAVDSAGNAYIAGATASPDFPITTGGNLGIAPAGVNNQRSFLVKLDPNGDLVFSDLLGGSAASAAQAVAVNSTGQIVVTGAVSAAAGPAFPSTTGAYSVATTTNHPYLLELDPTGTKIIFSATGIGGTALALDPPGNIYVSGTTYLLDYPTTAGSYQPAFPAFMSCFVPCQLTFQGSNQYVTKVDPTGSKLIYSTAVSGTGNATNKGLAVDAAGAVYLTGVTGPPYPYTVPLPPISPNPEFETSGLPFVSKLDPTGQTLLFSVPIGGAGIQVDSNKAVYVSGAIGTSPNAIVFSISPNLPGLPGIPAACLSNSRNAAYVAQLDASSGAILGSQFIGGSTLTPSAVALSGSTLWITGATNDANVPFTPNALTLPNLTANPPAGAYLGAVDFSRPLPPAGTPQVGCIIDAADFAPIGPTARYQLLTIVGTGLGPATGVTATDNSTTSLAGVTVNFGTVPAPLLYVSSTQINLAVPLVAFTQSSSPIQITVNGVNAPPLALPLTYANPSLFLNAAQTNLTPTTPIALALNADGSVNSVTNPAQLGSAISVFINGLTPDPLVTTAPPQFSSNYGWSVTDFVQATPFVIRVDLKAPTALVQNYGCSSPPNPCMANFTLLNDFYESVGPQSTPSGGQIMAAWVFIHSPFN